MHLPTTFFKYEKIVIQMISRFETFLIFLMVSMIRAEVLFEWAQLPFTANYQTLFIGRNYKAINDMFEAQDDFEQYVYRFCVRYPTNYEDEKPGARFCREATQKSSPLKETNGANPREIMDAKYFLTKSVSWDSNNNKIDIDLQPKAELSTQINLKIPTTPFNIKATKGRFLTTEPKSRPSSE